AQRVARRSCDRDAASVRVPNGGPRVGDPPAHDPELREADGGRDELRGLRGDPGAGGDLAASFRGRADGLPARRGPDGARPLAPSPSRAPESRLRRSCPCRGYLFGRARPRLRGGAGHGAPVEGPRAPAGRAGGPADDVRWEGPAPSPGARGYLG